MSLIWVFQINTTDYFYYTLTILKLVISIYLIHFQQFTKKYIIFILFSLVPIKILIKAIRILLS